MRLKKKKLREPIGRDPKEGLFGKDHMTSAIGTWSNEWVGRSNTVLYRSFLTSSIASLHSKTWRIEWISLNLPEEEFTMVIVGNKNSWINNITKFFRVNTGRLCPIYWCGAGLSWSSAQCATERRWGWWRWWLHWWWWWHLTFLPVQDANSIFFILKQHFKTRFLTHMWIFFFFIN